VTDTTTDDAVLGAPDDHHHGRPARAATATVSAVSVRGRPVRRTPLAWLPWAALALAAAIALAMVAIAAVSAADDGRDDGPSGSSPTTTAAPAPAPAGSSAAASPEAPSSSASAPSATVTAADGRSLLPLPAEGLEVAAGQPVEGRGAVVQSVVADEGFWIGEDETNRIFVHLSDEATASTGESPFQVTAGQHIDFSGTLTAVPDDVRDLGVSGDEGAEQLRSQGHYLELSKVALTP
jgi:hypothetical protein